MSAHQGSFSSYFLIFHRDRLIVNADYTPLTTLDALFDSSLCYHHPVGQFEGCTVYCAEWVLDDTPLPPAFIALPIKRGLERLSSAWYPLVVRAISIIQWDKNHRFCGFCGANTIRVDDLFEKRCPSCQLLFYPRISPSVIVLIEKGDEILMARSPHFAPGVFGLIAGFVEAGESLEEAVHREVKEEVGLTIKALHYVGSQSWPFPDSLVAGFRAHYQSGELLIDHRELETAGWYRYDTLPGYPSTSVSIARKLIDAFVLEKTTFDPTNS